MTDNTKSKMSKIEIDLRELFGGNTKVIIDAEGLSQFNGLPIFDGYDYSQPIGFIDQLISGVASGQVLEEVANRLAESKFRFSYGCRVMESHVLPTGERIIDKMGLQSFNVISVNKGQNVD